MILMNKWYKEWLTKREERKLIWLLYECISCDKKYWLSCFFFWIYESQIVLEEIYFRTSKLLLPFYFEWFTGKNKIPFCSLRYLVSKRILLFIVCNLIFVFILFHFENVDKDNQNEWFKRNLWSLNI